jgi:hypothetical protein
VSTEPIDPGHQAHAIAEFTHRLGSKLDELAATPVWSMTPAEQRDTLRELAKAEAQLSALRLRVLGEAERSGAGTEKAAASVADWVAIETRQTRISARSDLKTAQGLEQHPIISGALDTGAANLAQARVIVTASTGSRPVASSRSTPHNASKPSSIWSTSPSTTTRRPWRCWGGGCSR